MGKGRQAMSENKRRGAHEFLEADKLPVEFEIPNVEDVPESVIDRLARSLTRAVYADRKERTAKERAQMEAQLERVYIEHNSQKWLDYRKTGIGGSDAAAILGLSPFKTNVDVWEEKTGRREPADISDKPQVQYGKQAEDIMFSMFKLNNPEYKATVDKSVVYRRGFMFASLDGELEELATGELGIYEGKTSEIHRRTDLDKWDKRVPDYYYVQLLHYLIVTGRAFTVLQAQLKLLYLPDPETVTRQYRFERSELLADLKHLYLKEREFWGYVERGERPPLILPRLGRGA